MATIIDQLYVVLGLDATGFDKGRKQVGESFKKTREDAEKTGANMDKFGKEAGLAIGKLRNEALGLFLAFQGASSVTGFVTNMIASDAATGRLAANLGTTTTELSAYGLAVKSVGGDAKDAESALQMLATARDNIRLGRPVANEEDFTFFRFGKNDFKDPVKAFEKLARVAQTMDRPLFHTMAQRMGLTEGTINLLQLGSREMLALVEARKKDAAASEDDARKAQELQEKLANLGGLITGKLRPAIYGLVDGIEEVDKQVGLANVVVPVLTGLLGALAIAAVAATWPWIGLAAAIGGATAAYIAFMDPPKSHQKEITANGTRLPGPARVHSVTGRAINAETLRQIASGEGTRRDGSDAKGGGGPREPAPYKQALAAAGFSPTMVAAIMGNAQNESGFDPAKVGDGGKARGLLQWHPDRQANFKRRYGVDIARATPTQIADFIKWELANHVSAEGRAAISAAEASGDAGTTAAAFDRYYEKSAGLTRGKRMADARRFAGQADGRYARGGGNGGGSQVITHIGTINTQATDAKRLAEELPPAMRRRSRVGNASSGLEG